jgi:hypothetical protein
LKSVVSAPSSPQPPHEPFVVFKLAFSIFRVRGQSCPD